ncbi:MAG: tetratricopeptide repeat protein [Brevinematales bacterium]|nr:tetratricopeptide repeat protein [Brevinematales bacterium]
MIKNTIRVIAVTLLLTVGAWAASIDEAIYQLGYKMYQSGNYAQAVDQFNTLIAKHPYSPYYIASVYYCAKSYYAKGAYDKSLYYYGILERKAETDVQMRQAVFGIAQSYFGLKSYANAVGYFETFAANYKNSPVVDAAHYYAARCWEALCRKDKALAHYQQVAFYYPLSPYYKYALEKAVQLSPYDLNSKKDKPIADEPQVAKTQDNGLNEVDFEDYTTPEPAESADVSHPELVEGHEPVEGYAKEGSNTPPGQIKPILQPDDSQGGEKFQAETWTSKPENTVHVKLGDALSSGDVFTSTADAKLTVTNFVLSSFTNSYTNYVHCTLTNLLTNMIVVTQYVAVQSLDSNTVQIQSIKALNEKSQEEIDRLRQLLEMKAKLLDLKEKTLNQKQKIILTVTNK